jgi:hypothetical protein
MSHTKEDTKNKYVLWCQCGLGLLNRFCSGRKKDLLEHALLMLAHSGHKCTEVGDSTSLSSPK